MTSTDYKPVAQNGKLTLVQLIERMKPELARALPKHMSSDRMARIATTVLRQNPGLSRCTPESFLGALLTASQLGLEPGPLGEAYLVPYGNTCTFIPGYRGLIKLAWQSEQLSDIWAEVVCEDDEFAYDLGLARDLTHKPALGERGKPTHVYAAARLKSGGTPFIVMSVSEVEGIRSRSKAGKSGPWVTDWSAMAKKTAIKQLAKWLPMSSEFNVAAQQDEIVRDIRVTDTAADLMGVPTEYIEAELEATPEIAE